MDPLLHLANGLLLVSYAMRDILWLRLLTVGGLGLLLGAELPASLPLSAPLAWTLAFLLFNGLHAAWLLWERRPPRLSERESAIRELVFDGLTDVQFCRLLALATWEESLTGSGLMQAGQEVGQIRLIESGRARVLANGGGLHTLGPGEFIGEVGFLTGQPASAAVVAEGRCTCLCWPADALRDALEADPHLRAGVQGCLGVDVALKLRGR